jgi:hypothetical protein
VGVGRLIKIQDNLRYSPMSEVLLPRAIAHENQVDSNGGRDVPRVVIVHTLSLQSVDFSTGFPLPRSSRQRPHNGAVILILLRLIARAQHPDRNKSLSVKRDHPLPTPSKEQTEKKLQPHCLEYKIHITIYCSSSWVRAGRSWSLSITTY